MKRRWKNKGWSAKWLLQLGWSAGASTALQNKVSSIEYQGQELLECGKLITTGPPPPEYHAKLVIHHHRVSFVGKESQNSERGGVQILLLVQVFGLWSIMQAPTLMYTPVSNS